MSHKKDARLIPVISGVHAHVVCCLHSPITGFLMMPLQSVKLGSEPDSLKFSKLLIAKTCWQSQKTLCLTV